MTDASRWYSPVVALPADGQRVEWLDSSGVVARGWYERGLWFLESGVYVYYEPRFWRPRE